MPNTKCWDSDSRETNAVYLPPQGGGLPARPCGGGPWLSSTTSLERGANSPTASSGGDTIGIATARRHAVAPSLGTNLPYDPIKDFTPIGMIGSQPYVLVLFPGLSAHTLAQLIALAKAKRGTLNYGSAGLASL